VVSEEGLAVMVVLRILDRRPTAWAIVATIGAVLVAGCGPGGYSGPTGTVSGTVTLNGDPVPEGCSVSFVSEEGAHTASGTVGAGGAYKLSVVGPEGRSNDVPAATYKVCVTPPAAAGAGGSAEGADYEKMMEESAAGGDEPTTEAETEAIPAKYQSTTTSELTFPVKEGPNTIDIELQ
jgi:hypothetical protein